MQIVVENLTCIYIQDRLSLHPHIAYSDFIPCISCNVFSNYAKFHYLKKFESKPQHLKNLYIINNTIHYASFPRYKSQACILLNSKNRVFLVKKKFVNLIIYFHHLYIMIRSVRLHFLHTWIYLFLYGTLENNKNNNSRYLFETDTISIILILQSQSIFQELRIGRQFSHIS